MAQTNAHMLYYWRKKNYSVSQKSLPRGHDIFSLFSQTVDNFLIHFLHTYYTFLSSLEYKFFFNYIQL